MFGGWRDGTELGVTGHVWRVRHGTGLDGTVGRRERGKEYERWGGVGERGKAEDESGSGLRVILVRSFILLAAKT